MCAGYGACGDPCLGSATDREGRRGVRLHKFRGFEAEMSNLASKVVAEYRNLSPDRLLKVHDRWLRATFQPDIEISALSLPRGNAKSAVTGRLVALSMLPDSCLWRPGLETVVVAASMRQARIMWRFAKACLPEDEYRWLDSANQLQMTHKATGQVAYAISSSGKTAMGLSQFGSIFFDEPAALEVRNGAMLYDAVRQSLGKVDGQRLVMLGTRAPAEPGSWWPDLLDSGSGNGVHVTMLSAPQEEPWDSWQTIRKVNPVANVHEPLRRRLLRERDEARENPTMRRSFDAYRLNRSVLTYEDVLIEAEDWLRVESRDVLPREGACVVGIDLGGERSWSAAWCLWENGRSECYAVCPGLPDLEERERQDAMPAGLYRQLAADGVLVVDEGRRVSKPTTLLQVLEANGIRPAVGYHDRFLRGELRDAVDGRFPLVERVTRWSEATEDIAAFRQLVKDGPLSIAPQCRALARIALSQAVAVSDDQGNVRLSKKRHDRSRDDVAVAATLAAGHLVRWLRAPTPTLRVW